MKTLNDILKNIPVISTKGNVEIKIEGITADSREVKKGFLFVAIKGINTDGHKYINKAVKNGASAIICQVENVKTGEATKIVVKNSQEILGIAAANYYDNPSEKLKLIGIIGTNGKTTTATILHKLFLKLGNKTGLISTIKNYINKTEIEAKYTTPDAVNFNKLLNKMVQAGCEYCFAEISSHAIAQSRTAGTKFTGGVFTNITHEHLDYHKTFKEYLNVKKKFFDNLPKNAFALTNIDDKNGLFVLQNTKAKKYEYSLNSIADFKTSIEEKLFEGTLLNIDNSQMWTLLTGRFNAYNITAAYATAALLKKEKQEILQSLSSIPAIKGRFETITGKNKIAIIDYAHTADALKNVLETINDIRNNEQKIITVCGAGGDRDKTKRPEMAKIAANLSDKLILTSDNPRTEKPEEIIEEMYAGVKEYDLHKTVKITNRKEAIKIAAMLAEKNDIILIAGKGHENYQEINGVRYEFDDKKIVQFIMNNVQ